MKNLIILFLFLPLFANAQLITLTGNVNAQNEACAYANVILSDTIGEFVQGTFTDDVGQFELSVQSGKYVLTVTHINYKTQIFAPKLYNKDSTLQPIVLVDNAIELAELTVRASKPTIRREIDKTVVNIENSIMAENNNVFEALKSAPGLVVSNGQVEMLGKSGVRVSIDGRLVELSGAELAEFLASLPASNVKEIELMTNPSAKYEAESNSGIVNIITKTVKKESWNNRISLSHRQARLGQQSITNNFSYQKNKVSLLLSANYNQGKDYIKQIVKPNYSQNPQEIESKQTRTLNSIAPRFLLDYRLNETTTIGAQYLGSYSKPRQLDDLKVTIFNADKSVNSFLFADDTVYDTDRSHSSYNLYFDKKLDTLGRTITLNFDALDFKGTILNEVKSDSYDADLNFLNTDFANRGESIYGIKNYSAKADMTHPLAWMNLSYGAKASFSQTDYQLDNFNTITGRPVFNPLQSNKFTFQENIQSAYINGNRKLTDKWEMQFGLRAEATQTKGVSNETDIEEPVFNNNYTEFFPTFYLQHTHSEAHVFSFNYGRRINRPAYSQLNPSRSFLSGQTSQAGNPYLRPSFSNNVEFSHTFKRNLTTTLSFQHLSDAYSFLFELDDATQQQTITYKNVFDENSISLMVNYQMDISPWWTARPMLYFGFPKAKKLNELDNITLHSQARMYASLRNQFTLNKARTLTGELNLWYDSPYAANIYSFSQSYSIDLALRYKSPIKGLVLSVTANDLLFSNPRSVTSTSNGIEHEFNVFPSTRYVNFVLSYAFGNENIKTQERQFGNEGIRQRSN